MSSHHRAKAPAFTPAAGPDRFSAMHSLPPAAGLSRRDALKLAGAAGLAGVVTAYPGRRSFAAADQTYELAVEETHITIDGRTTPAVSMGGSIPAPTLRWREGQEVVVHIVNRLDEPTSIHWHGLLLEGRMDGSPGFNAFSAIPARSTFTYRFKLRQAGTYWYHSHSAAQEQRGMYGAIVIEPAGEDPVKADRDHVVLLSDHTSDHPATVMRKLKVAEGYYNQGRRTLGDFFRDAREKGLKETWQDRLDWGRMRMDATDLADVTGYSFLVNGKGPGDNWTALYRPGERVRLRIVNGSAMTIFDVRIPGLKMTVVAADGQDVAPVEVDEFRFGVGETYDVVITPPGEAPFTFFAEPIDRSGYARATLAVREGLAGPIPERRPRAVLTMEDMGMAHGGHGGMGHGGMDHGAAAGAGGMDHGAMHHSAMGHGAGGAAAATAPGQSATGEAMDHSAMGHGPAAGQAMDHAAMGHGTAPGQAMDHAAMGHASPSPQPAGSASGADHAAMGHGAHGGGTAATDHAAMGHGSPGTAADHAAMGHGTPEQVAKAAEGWADAGTPPGARALAYADLAALHPTSDGRAPSHEVEVRLNGVMERYIWTLNGRKFLDAEPIRVAYGERVRIRFVNETMMAHPMHLHGLFMELENGRDGRLPRKHVVLVPPGKTASVLVTASEPGDWPFHCHLLYHMNAGMMTRFIVEPPAAAKEASL